VDAPRPLGTVDDVSSPILADGFGHHIWATLRVVDACATLDDAQLATAVPGTYGTIIDTLRHLVGGDVFYLDVLLGGEPESFDEAASDIATLRAVVEAHDPVWQRLIADATDGSKVVIEVEANGAETHATLGIRLAQALHHGTDHRSQICTALTNLGIEPPEIDVWDYGHGNGRVVYTDPTDPAGSRS
jgi:uncharacterized damage-inducible protein DinB